jgi:hypothetical protein
LDFVLFLFFLLFLLFLLFLDLLLFLNFLLFFDFLPPFGRRPLLLAVFGRSVLRFSLGTNTVRVSDGNIGVLLIGFFNNASTGVDIFGDFFNGGKVIDDDDIYIYNINIKNN